MLISLDRAINLVLLAFMPVRGYFMDSKMNGFTKLYSGIINSSIWEEDTATRIVWITFLAMADANGNVIGDPRRLMTSANVSKCQFESAITKLTSPDLYSKSPEKEGRRIERIQGGWHLINYDKYRKNQNLENRRKQNREAKQRQRERNKDEMLKQAMSAGCQQMSAQAEAEAEDKEKHTKESSRQQFTIPPDGQLWRDIAFRTGLTDEEAQTSYDNYGGNGWKRGNGQPIKSWEQVPHILRYWRNNRQNFAPKKQPESVTEQFKRLKAEGEL